MLPPIPAAWADALTPYTDTPAWPALCRAADAAYDAGPVYPPRDQVFAALALTPPEAVRAVLLGQDPYHQPGQAMGLSFSVPPGCPLPRSLQNIYRELEADLGVPAPAGGDLTAWARQGVLLLNAVLTVDAGAAGSHGALGWQGFTDAALLALARQSQPIAFVLWGAWAQKKEPLTASHYPRLVLKSAHPSPLSARRGFFGSRPFSRVNEFLAFQGQTPIRWAAPPD